MYMIYYSPYMSGNTSHNIFFSLDWYCEMTKKHQGNHLWIKDYSKLNKPFVAIAFTVRYCSELENISHACPTYIQNV